VPESEYKPRSEVRFAVVMYGGVSLAIYINGVAQELFRLVRATAPNTDRTGLALADEDLTATEAVYREIGRRRTGRRGWKRGDLGAELPTPTRFVVDILTGTSAGGINGILLAKALANGLSNIDGLKKLWIQEGQIDDLLNEPRAYEGIDGIAYTSPPTSLLAGDRLLARAKEAIGEMGPRADGAPNYVDELDLTITMTDLQGLWGPIQLSDGKVWEPQHRADLKFVYATPHATGGDRNDFQNMDAALAFAARATSSFPFAFAPVRLCDVTASPTPDERALFGKWGEVQAEFESFAFADGGYLQNKPIAHATRALKRRRADTPVERKLLYVEPDPGPLPDLPALAKAKVPPDAIGNVGAALIGLPGMQPIREDIDVIRERNASIARIDEAKRRIVPDIVAEADPLSVTDPAGRSYLYLRRSDVIEALTETVLRASDTPAEGATAAAVRLAFTAHASASEDDLPGYLERLDLRFRLRRLTYLEEHIERLLDDPAGDGGTDELLAMKAEINNLYVDLRAAGRGVRGRMSDVPNAIDTQSLQLVEAVGPWLSRVTDVDAKISDQMWADPGIRGSVEGLVEAVETALAGQLEADSVMSFQGQADLEQIYRRAESIDSVIYPMTWPGLDETRQVDIHRVSPYDAASLVAMPTVDGDGEQVGRTRLAGISLGHFGGFLDEIWRRNDMLWGRLDGAERLVSVLVPHQNDREPFRIRAQAAILRDEFRSEGGDALLTLIDPERQAEFADALDGADGTLLSCFAEAYIGPADLQRSRQIGLGLSASGVAGKVLADNPRGAARVVGRLVGRLRPSVGVVIRLRERIRRIFRRN